MSFPARELSLYDEISTRMESAMIRLKEEYPFLKDLTVSDFFKAVSRLAAEEEELPSLYLNLSYQRAGISQNATAHMDCTLSLLRRLDQNKKILVFCERISQAETLYTRMRSSVSGKTRTRTRPSPITCMYRNPRKTAPISRTMQILPEFSIWIISGTKTIF